MTPAIFLDRDGTVIYDKVYLNDPGLVEFIPGAIEALKKLKQAGYLLIIITNQSGVARGLVQTENIFKIHERMDEILKPHGLTFDGLYFSPHAADSDHPQRKPNAGMIEDAIREHRIDRSRSWMLGDKPSDVIAGQRAHLHTVLLEETPSVMDPAPTYSTPDLLTASKFILKD